LNISFYVKGFFQIIFHFGAVEVQVAGLGQPMVLENISNPSQVKDFLWKTHNRYSQGGFFTQNSEVAHEILVNKPKTNRL
jgi:hypothetical protein